MNHVAHLLRTDVRRFRLLWSIWVLIHAADAIFRATQPALSGDSRLARSIDLVAAVLFLLRWLGMIVIVPLVMQEHPPLGSTAFWLTRPISWRAMFGAKVLMLGAMLVGLPAVAELILMWAFRVPAAEAVSVFLQTMLFQWLWMFAVMTFAATTANLARFALAAGALLVGLVLLINVTVAVLFRNLSDGPQLSDVTARSTQSAAGPLTLIALLSLAAGALVVVQYRTRLKRFSIPTGVAGLVLAVLLMLFWPWESRPLAVPAWAAQESSLQFVPDSTVGEFNRFDPRPSSGAGTSWRFGNIRGRLSGVEPGWLTTARLADSSIEFTDGTRLASAGNGYGGNVSSDMLDTSAMHAALRRLLAVDRLSENLRFVREEVPAIVVTEDQFRAHTGKAGTYHGRFMVDLDEMQIASTLPLEPGATFRDRGFRLVIDHVLTQGYSLSIHVRQFTTTVFDSEPSHRWSFYLRNRNKAEAIASSTQSTHLGGATSIPLARPFVAYSVAPSGGFNIAGAHLRFDANTSGDQSVDLTETWLAGAEFVIVRTVTRGSVLRTVVIPSFQMIEAPARAF